MKVVCDTNVLLSALVFPGGPPDQILELARAGQITNVTSPDILTELRRVLVEKFRYTDREAEDFVDRVLACSDLVYPTERLSVVTRKDADNRILEAAVAGEVELLITGDRRDLLPLRSVRGIRIVAPRQALLLL